MADTEFKPGDVVQLKSGGPAMTILWVEEGDCRCAWFVGSPSNCEAKEWTFPTSTVVTYVQKAPKAPRILNT